MIPELCDSDEARTSSTLIRNSMINLTNNLAYDPQRTADIIVESKTDYPPACKAAETLLFHKECLNDGLLDIAIRY